MPLEFGRNAFVNVASTVESTYGDGTGTFDVYNRIFSCTLKRVEERIQTSVLTTTDGGFARGQFKVSTIANGTVEVPLQYEGIGVWLKYALGSASSSAGPAPFTHQYAADTTDLPTFGIKFQRGSGKMEQFKGCMVSSMTISATAGEEAKLSCEILAQTSNARASAIPASFGDGEQVYHYEAGKMNYDSVNYDLYSFELTIDNKLETRYVLGSTLTASPDVNDIREVTLSVTCGLEDQNIYDAHLNGTSKDLTFTFTSGSDEFQIYLYNAVCMEYNDDITTAGRLERTATFKGFADAVQPGAVKIIVVNQDSSNVGN